MRRERNSNTLRVIVCGGRDFNDKIMLSRVLWYVHERRGLAKIIHGGQRAIEQMVNRWAFEMGIHRTEVRAEWSKYGDPRALLTRNEQMFDHEPAERPTPVASLAHHQCEYARICGFEHRSVHMHDR